MLAGLAATATGGPLPSVTQEPRTNAKPRAERLPFAKVLNFAER